MRGEDDYVSLSQKHQQETLTTQQSNKKLFPKPPTPVLNYIMKKINQKKKSHFEKNTTTAHDVEEEEGNLSVSEDVVDLVLKERLVCQAIKHVRLKCLERNLESTIVISHITGLCSDEVSTEVTESNINDHHHDKNTAPRTESLSIDLSDEYSFGELLRVTDSLLTALQNRSVIYDQTLSPPPPQPSSSSAAAAAAAAAQEASFALTRAAVCRIGIKHTTDNSITTPCSGGAAPPGPIANIHIPAPTPSTLPLPLHATATATPTATGAAMWTPLLLRIAVTASTAALLAASPPLFLTTAPTAATSSTTATTVSPAGEVCKQSNKNGNNANKKKQDNFL